MKLVFQSGARTGQEIDVKPGEMIRFGRESDVEVVLDDPRVSRPHAQMRVDADGNAWIEDLNSTNGTFVNGQKIERPTSLRAGDTLGIGNTRFSVGGKAAQKTIVAGQTEIAAAGAAAGAGAGAAAGAAGTPPAKPQSSTGLTMIRQNVASANRRAAIAIAVAVAVVAIAVVGGAYYLIAGRTLDDTEVVAQMKPTVVRILVGLPGGGYSSGTGWVIDSAKGLIVTNGHVIDAGQSFQVQADGIAQRNANVVAAAPCDDIAIIHVDDKTGLTSAKVGSQANLKQGERVWALGFPKTSSNESPLVANGGNVSVVKAPYAESKEADLQGLPNMILSTAEINHGNSGGPLITQKLEVVGMNTRSSIDPSRAEYWAIGIDRISELKDRLVNGQGIGYTGLSFIVPSYTDLAAAGYTPELYGKILVDAVGNPVLDQQGNKVLISDVVMTAGAVKGSQAELLGVTGSRVVRAIDGSTVKSLIDVCNVTGGHAAGQKSTFSFVIPTQDLNGRAVDIDLPYD